MREIKYRYAYKDKVTGVIIYEYFTLNDIEEMETPPKYYHCDCENYDIISRDFYTGFKDINGVEIYENDTYKNSWGNYTTIELNEKKENIVVCHGQLDLRMFIGYELLWMPYKGGVEIIGNIHE